MMKKKKIEGKCSWGIIMGDSVEGYIGAHTERALVS